MSAILRMLEAPYCALNAVRRMLYRHGALRPRRLPRPVISVGNIAAGGAGKTPAVIAICRYLEERGFRVAVLTRGYGRGSNRTGIVDDHDASQWGDEPVLIKRKTKATVIVGADRFANAREYLRRHDCDAFLLDDGFQHLQLHRDLDIVIDVESPFFRRETRAALDDADVVVERRIALAGTDALRGNRLYAFSGLADNDQFFESLREEGLAVTGTLGFPDHHRYTSEDLERIERAAKELGADTIVTTEKDLVKIDRDGIIAVEAHFVIPPDVFARIEATVRR
ncbi:MAG TPA: tetraacyldisaccharide 4'-kinase [Thermoanaerobaculia bacterium]|nr:tetraacyldisaccharide 4'-kinase [Thermoanaerobaculia bacterium]